MRRTSRPRAFFPAAGLAFASVAYLFAPIVLHWIGPEPAPADAVAEHRWRLRASSIASAGFLVAALAALRRVGPLMGRPTAKVAWAAGLILLALVIVAMSPAAWQDPAERIQVDAPIQMQRTVERGMWTVAGGDFYAQASAPRVASGSIDGPLVSVKGVLPPEARLDIGGLRKGDIWAVHVTYQEDSGFGAPVVRSTEGNCIASSPAYPSAADASDGGGYMFDPTTPDPRPVTHLACATQDAGRVSLRFFPTHLPASEGESSPPSYQVQLRVLPAWSSMHAQWLRTDVPLLGLLALVSMALLVPLPHPASGRGGLSLGPALRAWACGASALLAAVWLALAWARHQLPGGDIAGKQVLVLGAVAGLAYVVFGLHLRRQPGAESISSGRWGFAACVLLALASLAAITSEDWSTLALHAAAFGTLLWLGAKMIGASFTPTGPAEAAPETESEPQSP